MQTTVLAIDDDLTNLKILETLLLDENYNVITAINGQEALEILKTTEKEIKVIILDWMMPVMNGMEFLNQIKKISKYKDIPVIMQTAKSESENIVEGLAEGSYQYLTKPFADVVLIGMVKSAIAQYDRLFAISKQAEEEIENARKYADISVNQAQEKLRKYVEHQETTISQRTSDLQSANKSLESALNELKKIDHLKDETMATTSHELRTPLVSILGYADIIADCKLSEEERQRFANNIVEESERLVQIIDNILDHSKLSSGKIECNFKRTDLDLIIDKAVQAIEGLLLEKENITLERAASGLVFIGDAALITQVVVNILGNAIKFSPADSTIKISAQAKNDNFVLAIQDQGPGIPKGELEQIFESYQQAKNVEVQAKGFGLGLWISKKIIEAHSGKIWAENSQAEPGAIFYFSLPYNPASNTLH